MKKFILFLCLLLLGGCAVQRETTPVLIPPGTHVGPSGTTYQDQTQWHLSNKSDAIIWYGNRRLLPKEGMDIRLPRGCESIPFVGKAYFGKTEGWKAQNSSVPTFRGWSSSFKPGNIPVISIYNSDMRELFPDSYRVF